jgi:hypothetical protein
VLPLPDAFVEVLRDSAVAMVAALLIARWHPEHIAFAAQTMDEPKPKPRRKRAKKIRRHSRDHDDEALLIAMEGGGTIADWAEAISKSRTSVVTALHRLRDGGKAESVGGKWRLVEVREPTSTSKWTAPLRGKDRAGQAHLTASA